MHFWAKLLIKRLAFNPFVSNNSLRFKCFDLLSNKPIVIQNHFKLQNKSQSIIQFNACLINSRHLSSKSSNNKTKHITSDGKINNEFETSSEDLKPSIKSKFKKYSDKDSEVIYDVSEELLNEPKDNVIAEEWDESKNEIYLYQQKAKQRVKPIDIDLKRGETGVFDIHELVDLLRSENFKEIAVIEVPKELDYCQYLVLANGLSKRHINAFVEYFNKVYKMKKSRKDQFLEFGGKESPDWKCVDMKNIVLHIFMKPTRDYYDIETLWTVGHEFDDKTQRQETNSVIDIMEKHIKFLEEIKPKY